MNDLVERSRRFLNEEPDAEEYELEEVAEENEKNKDQREFTEARTGRLRRELELLRSHPKDERGSVREIGLCDWILANVPFSRLSPIGGGWPGKGVTRG